MIRTLQVYSGNLYGGVERTLASIARHGDAAAARREFALCFDGRLSRELTDLGVSVHTLGRVRVRNPLTIWRARRALRGVLSRNAYDVVICHSAWSQAIFGPVVRAARLPLVFWLHDVARGRHWVERWASRTAPDLVICNSRFTAGSAGALYPDARVEVLFPPIPLGAVDGVRHLRAQMRRELGASPPTTVIVQVSRLEPYKGHELHLEALARLRDLPQPWVCWMIGGVQRRHEARYLRRLHASATRLGIADQVRFLGQRSDVPALLAAADVHCQPNVDPEPFGITFVEALAAGLPVVTTGLGGAVEIVDDSCGVVVPPASVEALAAALRRFIQDPVLRSTVGAGGPARARKLCDPDAQLARLDSLLAALVAERAA